MYIENLFILANQRWRLKDDQTLENYEGITEGSPTWSMPEATWKFRFVKENEFKIENTVTGKFIHAAQEQEGAAVIIDSDVEQTTFKKESEDTLGYFNLVLESDPNLVLTASSTNTLTLEGLYNTYRHLFHKKS